MRHGPSDQNGSRLNPAGAEVSRPGRNNAGSRQNNNGDVGGVLSRKKSINVMIEKLIGVCGKARESKNNTSAASSLLGPLDESNQSKRSISNYSVDGLRPQCFEPGRGNIALKTNVYPSGMDKVERKVTVCCRHHVFLLEVRPEAAAVDIISQTANRMTYNLEITPSTCVVHEVYPKLGLERRLRGYERICDVMNTWDHDAQNHLFVTASLNPDAHDDTEFTSLPQSRDADMCGFQLYMYHSNKPGKWTKRWISLVEHGEIISAKEPNSARFENTENSSLCHLIDCDIYTLKEVNEHRLLRVPRKYCFVIKNQQNRMAFQNKVDYMQYFCTGSPKVAALFHDRVHSWRSSYMAGCNPEIRLSYAISNTISSLTLTKAAGSNSDAGRTSTTTILARKPNGTENVHSLPRDMALGLRASLNEMPNALSGLEPTKTFQSKSEHDVTFEILGSDSSSACVLPDRAAGAVPTRKMPGLTPWFPSAIEHSAKTRWAVERPSTSTHVQARQPSSALAMPLPRSLKIGSGMAGPHNRHRRPFTTTATLHGNQYMAPRIKLSPSPWSKRAQESMIGLEGMHYIIYFAPVSDTQRGKASSLLEVPPRSVFRNEPNPGKGSTRLVPATCSSDPDVKKIAEPPASIPGIRCENRSDICVPATPLLKQTVVGAYHAASRSRSQQHDRTRRLQK